MKLFLQSEASVLVVPGRLALVLEPGGACFHHVPPVALPTRHVTRFAAPKLQPLVKALLDFRNSLVLRHAPYVCDELYVDQSKTVSKHHVAVLLPTASRATGVWVQRKAGLSQPSPSNSNDHPMEFASTAEFLRQVQLAIHMDLKDVEIESEQVVCEETDEYCISCRDLNRWECLLLGDNSYMTLQQDGFVQHLTAQGPGKLYSAASVPREYSLPVARLVRFATVPTTPPPPLPLQPPASRLTVLHEVVDAKGNIFTAFSDQSVLVRFQDRTLAKVLPEDAKVAHLLLNTGETCLATIANREGEDFGFARYVRPLNRFLETCFLDPVARAQVEDASRLLQLRIHRQLCETRQVLRTNELVLKGARDFG